MKYKLELYFNIVFLNNIGKTYFQISQTLQIPFESVKSIMKRYRKRGSPVPDHKNCGRKVNENLKKEIKQIQFENKCFSLAQIKRNLEEKRIRIKSRSTILNYRRILKMKRRKISLIPYLTEAHIKKRKDFCSKYANILDQRYYSDESTFEMNYSKRGYVNYIDRDEIKERADYSFQKVFKF